jgi:FkbM family methyltransferase
MTLFPDAHYLLIEPLLANRDALTAFAATHQNVIVWHGAAGPEPGEILIHCHDDQSSALSANIVDWRGDESVTAPMRTLDSFIDSGEIDPPQFLKLDVQGFELAVLRGAKSALGSADAVLIEVSFQELYAGQPFADDIIAHMRDVGLRIHDICTYSQAKNGELLQSDLLFVRQDWQARRETIHG